MVNAIQHMILNANVAAAEAVTIAERTQAAVSEGNWLAAALWATGALGGMTVAITVLALVLIYAERKIAAHFQCRLGPMRVGPHGIFQTIADTIKLLSKEDIIPARADRAVYFLAPFLCLIATILVMLIIPYTPYMQIVDVNIGVLFVTAITGLGVLGILLGGWSSNSKWALLGAMRSGAQIISYEISATLALLVVVLFAGTMSLQGIVESQEAGWWIWRAHGIGLVAFILFVIASTAEINRTPFDIPEGESELTAGFHAEFSGLRFSYFFLAEFLNMFVAASLAATLFLGGWMPFYIGDFETFNSIMGVIPPGIWFTLKVCFIIFLLMWFRWTFPRLRVDQLMRLEWKVLLPVGFVNLLLASVVVLYELYLFSGTGTVVQ